MTDYYSKPVPGETGWGEDVLRCEVSDRTATLEEVLELLDSRGSLRA